MVFLGLEFEWYKNTAETSFLLSRTELLIHTLINISAWLFALMPSTHSFLFTLLHFFI